jgi:hypothetical protein
LLRLDANTTDHHIVSPTGLNIRGSDFTAIIIRVSRLTGSSDDFIDPVALYATAGTEGHGFDFAFRKRAPRRFEVGEFITFVFDMENLTAGGSDWQDSIIDRIRIDMSDLANDAYEIDFIGIARIGIGDVLDGNGLNLIANAYPTITDETDTDNESQMAVLRLDAVNLEAGDILSASAQIRALGNRAGTLLMRFRDDDGNAIAGDYTSRSIANQPIFETVEINGIPIPEGADRVALILVRADGVSGTVVARRPAMNVGSVAFTPINATNGATLGTNVLDEDGLTPVDSDEIRTADGQLSLDRIWDFRGTDLNWTSTDLTLNNTV